MSPWGSKTTWLITTSEGNLIKSLDLRKQNAETDKQGSIFESKHQHTWEIAVPACGLDKGTRAGGLVCPRGLSGETGRARDS